MTSRGLPRLAGIAVAAALFGVACGGTSDSADIASAPAATVAPAPGGEAPDVGTREILAFTSSLVGGGQFNGAELSDKPTAFWFWSPT